MTRKKSCLSRRKKRRQPSIPSVCRTVLAELIEEVAYTEEEDSRTAQECLNRVINDVVESESASLRKLRFTILIRKQPAEEKWKISESDNEWIEYNDATEENNGNCRKENEVDEKEMRSDEDDHGIIDGPVVDLTEADDDETKSNETKTDDKTQVVGVVKKTIKCECTRDIKCLQCCMKRKEEKDKLLRQQQQQKQKQQQPQQQLLRQQKQQPQQQKPKLQQQQQQQQHQPQQRKQPPPPYPDLSPTSSSQLIHQPRTYSSERVVTPDIKISDSVVSKKRQHPDTATQQPTSDIKGSVIDVDDDFVYILNGTKVRVVPKVTAMAQEGVADAVKRLKHGDDGILTTTSANTGITITQRSDPLQAIGLISQNSFGERAVKPDVVVNDASSVDPSVQYYGLIPVMPYYYYDNQKQELKPDDLKPGRRAKSGKPLLTTLTADLSMVQGPLPKSSLECHLCRQTYTDIHSLAHHNCSGIGQWRSELNAKWWKNFKA